MEAQFKHAQIDKEAAAAETDETAEALPPEEQAAVHSGVVFPVYSRPDTQQISPEEQKSRLAKAEAMYGAITESVEASETPDMTVNRRA